MDRFGSNQNRSWPMGSLVTNTSSESIMTGPFGDNCKKRRVTDDIKDLLNEANQNQQSSLASGSKRFLPLPKCDRIFHTEDWKPRGTTMFMPLLEDILVNLKNLEQISFNHGTFFVADDSGNYSRSLSGRTVNLWRYCEQSRRMYICRAFLFISQQDFADVQEYLQSL